MKKLLHLWFAALLAVALNPALASDKGSADEAVAMVKKAIAYIKAHGTDKAYAEFTSKTGQFRDRDLYIFVQDMNGTTLAHGGNDKLIGRNMADLRDADGVFFIRAMSDVAKTKGSGWVDYKWPNPATKAIEAKSTYVERHGDVFVGSGIYKK